MAKRSYPWEANASHQTRPVVHLPVEVWPRVVHMFFEQGPVCLVGWSPTDPRVSHLQRPHAFHPIVNQRGPPDFLPCRGTEHEAG
ncbi:hypothetical protein RO3G_03310 [Rhizopus delemar RA 99-880]|uniref:Uncharacterized protein n=1 Tax=Rhizopus delemar (strain RA 99-880 / ATCC MYA-4621 / FGSC 9543 / NRRL 43880) TaxID=246409 RepID=I1BQX6_RHIO9|nr:hypothetical protein RO3G_03310 [Rhizopus delemar RA 99-880]|eukprot:EIE78606.1 hypothetical protein RO3G_03310 [Rhizopus delemar RA 99-880]